MVPVTSQRTAIVRVRTRAAVQEGRAYCDREPPGTAIGRTLLCRSLHRSTALGTLVMHEEGASRGPGTSAVPERGMAGSEDGPGVRGATGGGDETRPADSRCRATSPI